jgi:hypothetical protein
MNYTKQMPITIYDEHYKFLFYISLIISTNNDYEISPFYPIKFIRLF